MWLTWKAGVVLCGCLIAVAVAIRPGLVSLVDGPWRRGLVVVRAVATEAAVVAGLYSIWQLAGTVSVMQVDGALERAQSIWDVERWVHLPSEVTVQHLVLPHPWLVESLNGFYAIVHGPSMLVFLVWMFARHRDGYPRARNTIAIVTGACLAIQLVPVAPPRMLDGLGFVDTGLLYHQSVYDALGRSLAYQLSAMPSVHVGWAVMIAFFVIGASDSRWRWLVLVDPVLTVWAVVATGNHFWLDGIVAVALIPVTILALTVVAAVGSRLRPLGGDGDPGDGDLEPTPAAGPGPPAPSPDGAAPSVAAVHAQS
ncbi:MAG: hypothetical protein V7605_2454 [Acidimicrobiaceae bacterium]